MRTNSIKGIAPASHLAPTNPSLEIMAPIQALQTLNLSQEIWIDYAPSNALDPVPHKTGSIVTVDAALRLALLVLNEDRLAGAANYSSLAAFEYLSAVVNCIDHQGGDHAQA